MELRCKYLQVRTERGVLPESDPRQTEATLRRAVSAVESDNLAQAQTMLEERIEVEQELLFQVGSSTNLCIMSVSFPKAFLQSCTFIWSYLQSKHQGEKLSWIISVCILSCFKWQKQIETWMCQLCAGFVRQQWAWSCSCGLDSGLLSGLHVGWEAWKTDRSLPLVWVSFKAGNWFAQCQASPCSSGILKFLL